MEPNDIKKAVVIARYQLSRAVSTIETGDVDGSYRALENAEHVIVVAKTVFAMNDKREVRRTLEELSEYQKPRW